MDIYLVRTDAGLRACTDEDYDKLHRFKVGEVVKASVVKPRNLAFHRKFFAMLRCRYELRHGLDEFKAVIWSYLKERAKVCVTDG